MGHDIKTKINTAVMQREKLERSLLSKFAFIRNDLVSGKHVCVMLGCGQPA